MNAFATYGETRLAGRLRRGALLLALALAPVILGTGPLDPLPLPDFSFDLQSPTVQGGTVGAGDILTLTQDQPTTSVPANALGLHSPNDDLDGLSTYNSTVPPTAPFSLLFSVDRQTVGTVPPDPTLLALGIPFNAWDQARRGQAAGDEFMSLTLFTRNGQLRGGDRLAYNNALVRNNYDEGGTDFGALPPTHAQDNANRVAQDNVDAAAVLQHQGPGGPPIFVYFSLTASSPSLLTLPGGNQPSGAHIFFNPAPLQGAPTQLYARFDELGLVQADDIDALIVFDTNQNGHFDGQDQVLFSLAPGSPSLNTLPGHSPVGAAADVYTVTAQQSPHIFAPAQVLGLGDAADNIDALDFFFCNDGYACAVQHGIRSFVGDLNCDNRIDFADIDPFVLALSDRPAYEAAYPDCNWYNGDCNRDGLVDFGDIDPFVALLGG